MVLEVVDEKDCYKEAVVYIRKHPWMSVFRMGNGPEKLVERVWILVVVSLATVSFGLCFNTSRLTSR